MKTLFLLLSAISVLSIISGVIYLVIQLCGTSPLAVWLVVQGLFTGIFCIAQAMLHTGMPDRVQQLELATEEVRQRINSRLNELQLRTLDGSEDTNVLLVKESNVHRKALMVLAFVLSQLIGSVLAVAERKCFYLFVTAVILEASQLFVLVLAGFISFEKQ